MKAQLRKSYGVLVGWGTRFADFNNDGWKDIYHSNGHVYPFLKNSEFREKYEQPGTFFLNQKNGNVSWMFPIAPEPEFRLRNRAGAWPLPTWTTTATSTC